MKKNNNKGFTLAELLIVVAIIAVLTAIAIPVFSAQLEKSRDSTDQANIRSAYAELSAALISNTKAADVLADVQKGKTFTWAADGTTGYKATIAGKGTNDVWDNLASGESFKIGNITVGAKANFTTVTFTVDGLNQITAIALS